MEVADREPGDAVSEEDGNPPVWWCARTDGVNFSVAEDGNEEEDCEKLYRVLAGHDEDEYPLFQQCAYSQIYFKLLEPREWDNANN